MILYECYYIFKSVKENIRSHWVTHLVTSAAVGFSLLLFATFLLLLTNLQVIANRWGSELQVTVYLQKSISEDERQALQKTIAAWREVGSVRNVTPEGALRELEKTLGEAASVLEGIPENPLPASLEVRLKKEAQELDAIRTVAERCRPLAGVAQVEYGGAWIGRFFALLKMLRWAGLFLGVLLLSGTLIVISSTLTLQFFARKDEIEIQRLVGATEAYVRLPFLLEALLQGVGGAGIAVLFCWSVYAAFRLHLGESWTQFVGWTQPAFLSPTSILALFLLGTVLGIISSVVSFSRFSRSVT
ncbi:MAG: ABC transporter permease [bacterium]